MTRKVTRTADMELIIDYDPVWARIDAATRAGAQDTLRDVQASVARQTGRLAASYRTVETSSEPGAVAVAITSDLPYAGAVERGADVGARRGPHMTGDHTLREMGPRFLEHTSQRLRSSS